MELVGYAGVSAREAGQVFDPQVDALRAAVASASAGAASCAVAPRRTGQACRLALGRAHLFYRRIQRRLVHPAPVPGAQATAYQAVLP